MTHSPNSPVQEWLGHSSIVVTMRYAHLADRLRDSMLPRLEPSGLEQVLE